MTDDLIFEPLAVYRGTECESDLSINLLIITYNPFLFKLLIFNIGIVLASSAGDPGFNPQSRNGSYQRRYINGTR